MYASGLFPTTQDLADLSQKTTNGEYSVPTLTEDECFRYFAYDYGWRQFYLKSHLRFSPKDPSGKWYREGAADSAERMFRAVHAATRNLTGDADILARCSQLYTACAERYRKLGYVCFVACKEKLQGQDVWRSDTRNPDSWRFRVAAAYRWKTARGETMPPGLADDDPRVSSLVAEYEDGK